MAVFLSEPPTKLAGNLICRCIVPQRTVKGKYSRQIIYIGPMGSENPPPFRLQGLNSAIDRAHVWRRFAEKDLASMIDYDFVRTPISVVFQPNRLQHTFVKADLLRRIEGYFC